MSPRSTRPTCTKAFASETELAFIRCLDVCFGFPSLDGVNQSGVVLLCLISVTLGPLRQSFIQDRGVAAVAGDPRRVPHSCMCACQQCSARPGIEVKGSSRQPFHRYRSLQILHLSYVVMSPVDVGIAQHWIVRGLQSFLSQHHPLPVVEKLFWELRHVMAMGRWRSLLHLQE